jgi:SAM-dependent methyltransferase
VHEGAYRFVARIASQIDLRESVIELGSRTVAGDWPYSGPVRPLFGDAKYLGVDIRPGPNVDMVADAATLDSLGMFDTVVCCETLEHTPDAKAICETAYRLLEPGGVFITTMAGEGRAPHSAVDGGPLREVVCERTHTIIDEFYRNVTRDDLRGWLSPFSFVLIDTGTPTDIYALAVK